MEKDKTGHDPAISPGNFKEYGRHLRMLFPKPSDTDIDATVNHYHPQTEILHHAAGHRVRVPDGGPQTYLPT